MGPHDIYAAQLAALGHGYALWVPEPRSYEEVRIGDVGYLLGGALYRLFNATLAANHPLNQTLGVPDGFVPFSIPPNSADTILEYFPVGPLHSDTITTLEVGTSVSG